MFSVSTPDLTDTSMSAFQNVFPHHAPATMARVQSHEPLPVASCPTSPVKRRASSFLPVPPGLRKFVTKLTARRKSQTRRRPGSSFLTASRAPKPKAVSSPPRRATLSAGRAPIRRGNLKQLGICDPAFFLAGTKVEAENGYDGDQALGADDEDEDGENHDAADGHDLSVFRAPPPTPIDPFTTPPRGALFVIGNSYSPQRLSGSPRRRQQQMKIVQKLGVEAAGAAEEHTRTRRAVSG
ncbi:hypothetical protein B0H13DRAFT_2366947 [Mycena leptocephala]|nr:hypothetical protein B0H13DRAFT_2366947 [Mycena leptocephala]